MPKDITNQKELIDILEQLSTKVALRLKNKKLVGQKIGVTIRYKDRRTVTRSRIVENPFFEKADIHRLAVELFKKHWNGEKVRLLGVTAFDVMDKEAAYKQLDLFSYEKDAEEEPLFHAMEKLQSKYGKEIIKRGVEAAEKKGQAETSFSKDFLDNLRLKE